MRLLAAGIVCIAVTIAAPARAAVMTNSSGMFGGGGALPAISSDVRIEVRGPFAEVKVTQTFRNDLDRGIEAVYVFPLPGDASVRSMTIKTGDRTITAKIAAREEARRAYEQAVADGTVAALTEEERANVFTQQVTGIEAGAEIKVELRFDMAVGRWRDGWELVLPLVVAPRHVPGEATGDPTHGTGTAPDTDVVDDASRVTPPVRSQGGNPVTVAIDLGDVPKSAVEVPSHDAEVTTRKGRTLVKIDDGRSDRDLVVRWPGEAKGGARVVGERAGDGGAVALIVEAPPPAKGAREKRRWVLVLDASGSMDGDGIALLRKAGGALLDQIAEVEGEAVAVLGPAGGELKFRKGTQGLAMAKKTIAGLEAKGGTGLGALLATALGDGGADLAIVVISDGLIADDETVAAQVTGRPRVHAVGVGAAPNRWLLDELARRGRGVATVLTVGEDVTAAMTDLAAAARAPTAELQIDWGGLGAHDVAPAALPELAAGRSAVIAARFDRIADATITVRAGDARYTADVRSDALGKGRVVTRRWARARIDDLLRGGADVEAEVTRLGLDHELVTPYTALVARGEQVTVKGGVRTTVAIPVAMPAGMRWQSVFGPGGDAGEGLPVQPDTSGGTTAIVDRDSVDAEKSVADEESEAPMAAPMPGADYAAETISVSGRYVMDRVWNGSLSLSTGLHLRGEDRGTQVNLSAGAYRSLDRAWKIGAVAKLQIAPAFEGGVDAAAYLTARRYIAVGFTPLLALDLGAGPSLDTAGLAWRAALRLGSWTFAPVLSFDQTWTPAPEGEDGWNPRTNLGIGLDWAF